MNKERLEVLKARNPNYRVYHGKRDINNEREFKIVNLHFGMVFDNGTVSLSALYRKLREIMNKYPQFDELNLEFFRGNGDDIEMATLGRMRESVDDVKKRNKIALEENELYDLIMQEAAEEQRKRDYQEYLQLQEKFKDYDMVNK